VSAAVALNLSAKVKDPWGVENLEEGLQECPVVDWDLLNRYSGLVVPARCDTYSCPFCGPGRVREWVRVLAWAVPQRFVTLTGLSADRFRGELREFVYRVRKEGFVWEWAWSVEANPRGTGFHVHAVQWGDYVPVRAVSRTWGGRIVDMRAIKTPKGGERGSAAYALKEGLRVAGYSVKAGVGDLESYYGHLARNGGRPVHLSRGYLRGQKVDEVRRELRLSRFGEDEGENPWVRIPKVS
jgi:hypothetical protein